MYFSLQPLWRDNLHFIDEKTENHTEVNLSWSLILSEHGWSPSHFSALIWRILNLRFSLENPEAWFAESLVPPRFPVSHLHQDRWTKVVQLSWSVIWSRLLKGSFWSGASSSTKEFPDCEGTFLPPETLALMKGQGAVHGCRTNAELR